MATLHADIIIKAPAEKVFKALTNPDLVRLWQFDREVITDWKNGSNIRFRTEYEDKILEQWGTILDVRQNELVKYNLFTPRLGVEDSPENYFITSYVLTNDNGNTKVEIIQDDNRPGGFLPATIKPILVALKKVVERN